MGVAILLLRPDCITRANTRLYCHPLAGEASGYLLLRLTLSQFTCFEHSACSIQSNVDPLSKSRDWGAGIPEVWPHPISGGFWLSPVPGDQGRLSQAARLSPLSEL